MTKNKSRMVATLMAGMLAMMGQAMGGLQTLEPDQSQEWKFSHSPEMTFQSEFGADGLMLQFQGVAGSPNYMSASAAVEWETPAKGNIEVSLRAEQDRGIYFAVEIATTDGKTYQAVASGDPKRGYKLAMKWATAELPISMFVDKQGNALEEGQLIARIGLIFAVEPDISNTVYINKVSLISGDS